MGLETMTTFTTEDRIQIETPTWEEKWGKRWIDAIQKDWNNQTSIQYFWPLTEQTSLDLDYTECEINLNYTTSYNALSDGTGLTYQLGTWTTTAPQLTVENIDSVGQLSIGGIRVGMESEPNIIQKGLYKLLGFNWKPKA